MGLFDRDGVPDNNTLTPKWVRDKYETSVRSMRRERYDYIINRSFLRGEQWVYWDGPQDTLRQVPRDPARVRATVNKLWPASRHLMSKLLSRDLVFEVPAGGTDDATIKGAHIAEAVVNTLYREHKWEDMRSEIAWNSWLGGTGAISVDWDAKAGATLNHSPLTGEPVGTGEICTTPLTILEMAWEPGVRDAERGYWWIRAQALPPEEVQSTYKLPKKPPADASAVDSMLNRTVVRDYSTEVNVELTLVLTYYERPNSRRPNGAVATVINGEFVGGVKPWTFPFKDRLNLVVFRETKVSGRASGDTVFSAAVPIQTAYNASWSNIIEHLKLAGNARLMIPEGSVEGIDELSDMPGEMFTYNAANGVPEWLTPATLPAWVLNEPDMLSQQIDDIMGLHDVSRGEAPTNIESGVGLSVLVEQDSTPLGGMTKEIGHGFERLASMILEIYKDKVKESRTAKVQAPGQVPEIVQWTGKALANQTTVVIPMDAIMPRSRTAMAAFARELWDRKIITDPREYARISDLPEQSALLEGMDPDAAKAIRENHLMGMGSTEKNSVIPIPAAFDNHQVHILRHNNFRKTSRYEAMTEEDREIVDLHIQGHEVMAAEQMGAQVAKSMIHPALAAVPTADGAAALPEGMVPAGAAGGPGPMAAPMEPGGEGAGGPPAEPTEGDGGAPAFAGAPVAPTEQ